MYLTITGISYRAYCEICPKTKRKAHCFVLLFEALMEEFMEVLLPDLFDNEGQTFCWFLNHIENLICVQN